MDPALKHRLIGAAVLSALAIIFLPMLIVGHDKNNTAADVPLTVPGVPGGDFQTRELPLIAPASGVPDGGVVGMDSSHPAASAPASPAVDANGQPLPGAVMPAGVMSASSSSTAAASPAIALPAAPVATMNAASPTVAPTPASATPAATTPASTTPAPVLPLPVATAPSAPITAASAGGHYVVSLGTYSNAANAQSLVTSLKGSQLPAYAEPVNVAGKMQTRVRIGPFAQRGDAEAARLKAQQVRTDMPASVTALDAASPASPASPANVLAAPANKPVSVPAIAKPAAIATAATSKPVVPPASTAAIPGGKPTPPVVVPPVATSRPVASSPAAAGRGYAVQVSAFRSEDEALTLRDKLRAAGFTAFSERIKADSGTLFRVRIGPEADRDAADHLRTELSTKMGMSGMVVGYP